MLLEHGRSSWEWLNKRMDAAAQQHFDKWGCWFNRDIASIVKEVSAHVLCRACLQVLLSVCR